MSDKLNLPIVVLGAGMSGLSCAWKLAQNQIPVVVLEKEIQVGGLAGTIRDKGYALDFGPHSFFSEDKSIQEIVLNLFHDKPLIASPRRVRFYYRGKYLDYPLSPFNVLFQMGLKEGVRCLWSYLTDRRPETSSDPNLTVEEWAKSNFGSHLYQVFFKPYTEQFWKMPASELSARSIPSHTRLSFVQTLRHLLQKKVSVKNPSLMDREKLPTFYPPTGYGEIPDAMAEQVIQEGGEIKAGASVYKIDFSDPSAPVVHYQMNGESFSLQAAHVISTLPVTLLIKLLTDVPSSVVHAAASLHFRPLLFLGMMTSRQNVLPCSYLYTLDRPYNRITEMNHFSPETSPEGKNMIAVEIPCRPGDALLQASKEELFERCIDSLSNDGFLHRSDVTGLLMAKSAYAYPVYTKDYAEHLVTVINYLQSFSKLQTLGRSGEFRYMDGDQCMRRSFDCADRLLQQLQTEMPLPC